MEAAYTSRSRRSYIHHNGHSDHGMLDNLPQPLMNYDHERERCI